VEAGSPRLTAQAQPKLDASILSYDGQDFVRTKTTLMTADGKSAVNTKLDRDTPAFKALVQKHSYTGEATVFGKKYDGNYAPLTSADGKLTGALFVGVPK
jgi:methyl-accepting chemotaxis protein-2 (aspartate sensor receptor)